LVGSEGFVHGVEREDSLLALARAQTRQCGNVRLHHTDIREFSRLGSWSAAVAVLAWNFIGCITEDERAAALESSMSVVTGGGLLVGTAYSEDAWQAQREQYESNGARVAKIDERFVHCPQMGFRSERFAKPSLEQLLGAYGPVRVERISPIAYGYVIERICHEACA
jgi:hypothetical protein